ncbi:MAG: hypothetical protein KDD61_17280 [Bdellovibrionales bacterium]|nr:hypothetical protein [Bdellovibrionales bacterium]
MKKQVLTFIGLLVVSPTLWASDKASQFEGHYSFKHTVQFYGESLEQTDTVVIKRTAVKNKMKFRIFTMSSRGGNTCELEGTAELSGAQLVFDESKSGRGACRFTIEKNTNSLVVSELDRSCADYCGMNADFSNSYQKEYVDKRGLLFKSLNRKPTLEANKVLVYNINKGHIETNNWFISADESTCMVFKTKSRQANIFTVMTMMGDATGEFSVEEVESCN